MRVSSILGRFLLVCLCLLQIQCTVSVNTQAREELKPFFGTYSGKSVNIARGEISERELAVTIKPWEKTGFTIEWTAITYRTDGEQKKAETSIDFYSSSRPGIFASAMRKDVFGNMVSYDPVAADATPYVWAALEGDTLTVRALYITDSGEYEIHIYERTLRPEGLALDFERLRNGEVVTQVEAMLERTEL